MDGGGIVMAIDYTQLTALTAEIQSDPNAYGYAAFVAEGNDQGIADLLNLRRDGVSAPGAAITVYRNDVRKAEIIGAFVVTDYDALTAARRDLVGAILQLDVVDATDATLRSNLAAVFAAGTTTRANLVAMAQRAGSRAEALFGTGAFIAHQDVARALGRG